MPSHPPEWSYMTWCTYAPPPAALSAATSCRRACSPHVLGLGGSSRWASRSLSELRAAHSFAACKKQTVRRTYDEMTGPYGQAMHFWWCTLPCDVRFRVVRTHSACMPVRASSRTPYGAQCRTSHAEQQQQQRTVGPYLGVWVVNAVRVAPLHGLQVRREGGGGRAEAHACAAVLVLACGLHDRRNRDG